MPGLRDARPVLGPLISWSKAVITESRRLGHEDCETAGWIKACAKNSGWTTKQIDKALRFNGVRRKNPNLVICPKCEDVGRLNFFLDEGNTCAVITHGKLRGYWGTLEKMRVRKRTRCFFHKIKSEDRQRLLQQMYEKLELIRRYG
jgi:hypothetical protein